MHSTIACGLVVSGMLAGAALAADQRPVEPGGKIGAMTVIRGDDSHAKNMWASCPTHISKPGIYHRSCSPSKSPRLYIGASDSRATQKELDSAWKNERWSLWVDRRPVDLPRFGASVSHGFNGHDFFSKSWRVILVDAPSGKHTIHYRWRQPSGVFDVTMNVTVQ